MAAQRAAPVAAPGATRLTLTGIMAVPDGFGRLRILLVDRLPGGAPDLSWLALRDQVPWSKSAKVPYQTHPVDAEGVRGEFWAVAPAHRRKHWLELAAELRGRFVKLEVTARRYAIRGDTGGADAESTHGASHGTSLDVSYGTSLDVSLIEPANSVPAGIGQ
jgi:hypothetical protein